MFSTRSNDYSLCIDSFNILTRMFQMHLLQIWEKVKYVYPTILRCCLMLHQNMFIISVAKEEIAKHFNN